MEGWEVWSDNVLTDAMDNAQIEFINMQVADLNYRAWNTTMDKPIHEHEHNDCQQLITKSHGQS